MVAGKIVSSVINMAPSSLISTPNILSLFWITYRQEKLLALTNPAPFPTVPKDQLKTFTSLVGYLGLSDEIVSSHKSLPQLSGEKFNLHSSNIALQENRKVAAHDGSQGYGYILGENVYNKGNANLKLKFESLKNNYLIFVGMVEDDAVTYAKGNISNRWPGSYGCVLGSHNGEVWKNGTETTDDTLTGLAKQGDTFELVLDCETGKLSLHLPTGQEFHINIPRSESWKLNMTLFHQMFKNSLIIH